MGGLAFDGGDGCSRLATLRSLPVPVPEVQASGKEGGLETGVMMRLGDDEIKTIVRCITLIVVFRYDMPVKTSLSQPCYAMKNQSRPTTNPMQ